MTGKIAHGELHKKFINSIIATVITYGHQTTTWPKCAKHMTFDSFIGAVCNKEIECFFICCIVSSILCAGRYQSTLCGQRKGQCWDSDYFAKEWSRSKPSHQGMWGLAFTSLFHTMFHVLHVCHFVECTLLTDMTMYIVGGELSLSAYITIMQTEGNVNPL